MPKDSEKKIYGLIGFPVKHSLSAFMHNAAFKALGINAQYRLFEIKPEELEVFLGSLNKENIFGLNITVPYKERILDFITFDVDSFYLKKVRAVNTILNKGAVWKGFNTDIPGFSRHLKENFEPAGKRAAILGAGGAARAVAYVLADSKAKNISIFDIDKVKAQNVANMVKSSFDFPIFAVDNIEGLEVLNKDLLINATPVGLNESDPLPVAEELLHKNLFVYDLIYNPAETKLLSLAKKIGAKTSNGLGMLLYQGMLSFEIWTGKKAPKEVMEGALLEAMGK